MENFSKNNDHQRASHFSPDELDIFIVAEIGINHNGDIEIAKRLIDQAVQSGCSAVKFQKRTISTVYPQSLLNQPRESPWGTTQRDQKEGLEFSYEDYRVIDDYCKRRGIPWFASAWDIESQRFLRTFDCPYNKIASAMLTHKQFITFVAEEKKVTFISTGMSTLQDIDQAVEIFENSSCPFILLHSVSTYPANEADLNLRVIQTLKERYGCMVGYSGHESSVSPSIMAAVLGAKVIERHITLDRAMYGSDQSASLEPNGLQNLVSSLRKVAVCLGDGEKRILEGERIVARKLRYWES